MVVIGCVVRCGNYSLCKSLVEVGVSVFVVLGNSVGNVGLADAGGKFQAQAQCFQFCFGECFVGNVVDEIWTSNVFPFTVGA